LADFIITTSGFRFSVHTIEAIKQAVAVGFGVSILSNAAVGDQVAQGRLKIVPIRSVNIKRQLWQLKIPGRLDAPAAVVFEQILNDTSKRLPIAVASKSY